MSSKVSLQQLQRSISEGQLLNFTRGELADHHLDGYPLAISDELLLIRRVGDFLLDGFALLRRKDISEVRCGPAEHFIDYVLREEGLLAAAPPAPALRLDSWRSALEDIKRLYQYAILEREDPEDPMFYIGALSDIGPKKIALRYFMVEGVLEAEKTVVSLKKITQVRFEERYIQCFAKYSKEEER